MRDEERQRQAREALERVARDSETIGASSVARAGRRMKDHFTGKDALEEVDGGDWVEIWGRRIGRALSLIGVVVLAYLVGGQLRLW